MTEYKKLTDEELIRRLRMGETGIIDYLMEKYKNLVRKEANAMYLLGGETDDLIQEGMIGLFKAVQDYDVDQEASFFSFAYTHPRYTWKLFETIPTGVSTSAIRFLENFRFSSVFTDTSSCTIRLRSSPSHSR